MQLFLLLPEYKYQDNVTTPYLESGEIRTDDDMRAFLKRLSDVVTYLGYESQCTVYYDSRNFKAFTMPVLVFPDEYPGIMDYLKQFVERRLEDWRMETAQSDADNYAYDGQQIVDDTLCEISKRKSQSHGVYAIINHDAISGLNANIGVVKVSVNGIDYDIPVVRALITTVADWMADNRDPKRIYLPNEDKHGEDGIGGHSSHAGNHVSKLLCSNEEAERMMHRAVQIDRHLYYFDQDRQLYIKFMSGSNGTFHSYHITTAQDEQVNVKHEAKKVLRILLGDFKSQFE